MQKIIEHIEQNIQDIYRKSLDADHKLNQLKQQGMAKFTHIFQKQQLFNCQQDHFMPYVNELAENVIQLKQNPSDQALLLTITKQLELMHKILAAFKQATI